MTYTSRLKVTVLVAAMIILMAFASSSYSSAPSALFSSKAPFQTVAWESDTVRAARDARDLALATRLAGKPASFRGDVARIFSSSSGKYIALDFDKDFRKALVAVALGDAAKKLPGLRDLTGMRVVVSGKVEMYHGQPEVKIESASQIKIVASDVRRASRAN